MNNPITPFGSEVIGSDLDGVIYPWQKVCHERANAEYRLGVTYEELWSNIKKYEAIIDEIATRPDTYSALPPVAGAVQAYRKIAKFRPIIYITNRPENAKEETARWIAKYFPYAENLFVTADKVSVVKQYQVLAFIEDRLGVADLLAPHVGKIIIRNHIWNQEHRPDYLRVNSVKEVPALLRKLETCGQLTPALA